MKKTMLKIARVWLTLTKRKCRKARRYSCGKLRIEYIRVIVGWMQSRQSRKYKNKSNNFPNSLLIQREYSRSRLIISSCQSQNMWRAGWKNDNHWSPNWLQSLSSRQEGWFLARVSQGFQPEVLRWVVSEFFKKKIIITISNENNSEEFMSGAWCIIYESTNVISNRILCCGIKKDTL